MKTSTLSSLSLFAAGVAEGAAVAKAATYNQQIAIASYIDPTGKKATWDRLVAYDAKKVSVLIGNPYNGPDYATKSDWKDVIDRSIKSGKKMLGYVRTGYLSQGKGPTYFETRLGSNDTGDWVAQIERDIDAWYTLYGTNLSGIFFDESWNGCGDNDDFANVYAHLNDYTKRKYPGAFTVQNPGTSTPKCFQYTADTIMTYERDYDTYVNNYTPFTLSWVPDDPRKLWHIIYNVPENNVAQVAALASERHAGLVQITNKDLPNPYDDIPSESYIQKHIDVITGGTPLIAPPMTYPAGAAVVAPQSLTVNDVDYININLSWAEVPNAQGYRVYSGKEVILDVFNTITQATIPRFQPGTSYTFTVRAIGGAGKESADSNAVTTKTLALPKGSSISNLQYSVSGSSSTYEADMYYPYGQKRAYIWDDENSCKTPGYPVYIANGYVCAKYKIEGGVLAKYNSQNIGEWSWLEIGKSTDKTTGYTVQFTVPNDQIKIDASHFAFQAEHDGPINTVAKPCPAFADPKSAACA